MSAATEFSLRAIVRAFVMESDEIDPDAIAEQIVAALSDDERLEALRQALPEHVREAQSARRTIHRNSTAVSGKVAGKSKFHPDRWTGDGNDLRERLFGRFDWSVNLPDGTRKLFKDCTALDCDVMKQYSIEQARAFNQTAVRWERVAHVLRSENRVAIKDCPTPALVEIDDAWNGSLNV